MTFPKFYFKNPKCCNHVAMARGRSMGPQELRGKGVTPAVSSGGLRQIPEGGPLIY